MTSYLNTLDGLADYSQINSAEVVDSIKQQLDKNKQVIAELEALQQPTWQNSRHVLEQCDNTLGRMMSAVSHMNSVVNNDDLREAYNQCVPLISQYYTELGQNQNLYTLCQAVAKTDGLSPAQQQALENDIRDFRHSGIALPEAEQAEFKQISEDLALLSSRFSDNVMDSTKAWQLHITDEAQLAGLPDSAKGLLQQNASNKDLPGWLVNLDFPSFFAVMTYADDRSLRETVYRAYVSRASAAADDPQYNNDETMAEIVQLRHKKAQLLGYPHYADYSLSKKMATDTDSVFEFLQSLLVQAKPLAEKEKQNLSAFAQAHGLEGELEPWDSGYYSEKMKQDQYAISDELLRPYFAVEQVIDGLFSLSAQLFGIRIEADQCPPTWHEDVRFYAIKNTDGETIAQFYFDLYARENKRGGAWMADYQGRFLNDDGLQIPIAYMTCNATPPTGDQPALFTHDEVITLFHEFGHGLQHMLTQVDTLSVSGISGIEWDAVELPSQFMENFCWQTDTLQQLAKHHETGEAIPTDIIKKLQQSKNHLAAMGLCRQLEFALFDMQIHSQSQAIDSAEAIQQVLDNVRAETSLFTAPDYNHFQNSFGHIFAGGYAAGYYSYLWAEVLSADAFQAFVDVGLDDPEIAQRYQDNVLGAGGSRPALDSYIAFRGHAASVDALLIDRGIVTQ